MASPDIRKWGGEAFIDVDRIVHAHQWELASPVTHLSHSSPPVLIIHGDKDKTVKIQQSLDFIKKLKNMSIIYEFVRVKEGVHSFDLQPPQMDLRPVVLKFLSKNLAE